MSAWSTNPPDRIVGLDWSARPRGRWAAVATAAGGWVIDGPVPYQPGLIGRGATELVVVDAVIGVPRGYAARAALSHFHDLLRGLDQGRWAHLAEPAERPQDISVHRPFYPRRPAGARLRHLSDALGLPLAGLWRRCDGATTSRPAATPLFWTVGPAQVGRASLSVWRELLRPLDAAGMLRLWPFDGPLDVLVAAGGVTVAEGYPREYRHRLGLGRLAKQRHGDRRSAASALHAWAQHRGVRFGATLGRALWAGFGDGPHAADAFDAVLAVCGAIDALEDADRGVPRDDPAVVTVEGWILGLDAEDLSGA